LIICFSSSFGQVKENEILQRDNHGTPKLIKLKETQVSDDLNSIKKFLKEQFTTESKVGLSLNHLPNGMYFLKIDGENSVIKTIMIQH